MTHARAIPVFWKKKGLLKAVYYLVVLVENALGEGNLVVASAQEVLAVAENAVGHRVRGAARPHQNRCVRENDDSMSKVSAHSFESNMQIASCCHITF
jgi:hypothetical protein